MEDNAMPSDAPTSAFNSAQEAFRRAIRIFAAQNSAGAELEDDVHHFHLALRHQNGVLTEIAGSAVRTPWTVCPGALSRLRSLRTMKLTDVAAMPAFERAQHCTHLYDLLILAASHARKNGFERRYRAEVDFDLTPPRMKLWRDDILVLGWEIVDGRIAGSVFDGLSLRNLSKALSNLTPDEAEAALILRRVTMISPVRAIDLDAVTEPKQLNAGAAASCYAHQPPQNADLTRARGNSRDFWGDGGWPLA